MKKEKEEIDEGLDELDIRMILRRRGLVWLDKAIKRWEKSCQETLKEKAQRIKEETAYEEEPNTPLLLTKAVFDDNALVNPLKKKPYYEEEQPKCDKCGDNILGDENSMCGKCV